MPPDGVTYGLAWIDAVILLLLALLITSVVLGYVSEASAKRREKGSTAPEQSDTDNPERPRAA